MNGINHFHTISTIGQFADALNLSPLSRFLLHRSDSRWCFRDLPDGFFQKYQLYVPEDLDDQYREEYLVQLNATCYENYKTELTEGFLRLRVDHIRMTTVGFERDDRYDVVNNQLSSREFPECSIALGERGNANIRNFSVEDTFWEFFAAFIASNDHLQTLDFSMCCFSGSYFYYILDALQTNGSIRIVNFSGAFDRININSLVMLQGHLIDCLDHNRTITVLNLLGIKLDLDIQNQVLNFISQIPSIKELSMGFDSLESQIFGLSLNQECSLEILRVDNAYRQFCDRQCERLIELISNLPQLKIFDIRNSVLRFGDFVNIVKKLDNSDDDRLLRSDRISEFHFSLNHLDIREKTRILNTISETSGFKFGISNFNSRRFMNFLRSGTAANLNETLPFHVFSASDLVKVELSDLNANELGRVREFASQSLSLREIDFGIAPGVDRDVVCSVIRCLKVEKLRLGFVHDNVLERGISEAVCTSGTIVDCTLDPRYARYFERHLEAHPNFITNVSIFENFNILLLVQYSVLQQMKIMVGDGIQFGVINRAPVNTFPVSNPENVTELFLSRITDVNIGNVNQTLPSCVNLRSLVILNPDLASSKIM